MFLTKHDGFEDKYGRIDYTVWSDIFLCSNCNYETIYLEQAIDYENHKMKLEWNCPNCNSKVQKSKCDKAFETKFDIELNSLVKVSKTVPYLIYYTFRGRRYNKIADKFDLELIQKISEKKMTYDLSAQL